MNFGKYKIAQQINNKGIYAGIELEAEINLQPFNIKIEYETSFFEGWQSGTEWKSAIAFGTQYFLAHIDTPYNHRKGIYVKVIRFQGHEVDTTMALVSIVTIKALMDALKVSIYKEPFVDTKNFIYCFPF
ncbi:hypothetical protein GXP67_23525 [Rhodocytophaga rosea]|uniref:Uncharacterized protein n=1 Tax=Rhodocytophaga rosea TaxID=2704465 RepID=A0A6C0GN83_9BACT|nr:hypothetical protein [Rhodocytophaga rosea]QHT69397.1 hypothetical protein GXP67_23525 [Rhodocytophaga rosea]